MNIEDYRAIRIKDCEDNNVDYGVIMLHNKHSVKDLQDEINRIKREKYEEIMEYGNDLEVIKENISSEFNWFELDTDIYDYVEV